MVYLTFSSLLSIFYVPYTVFYYLLHAYADQNYSRNYLDSIHIVGIIFQMSYKGRVLASRTKLQREYYGSDFDEPRAYYSGT